MKRRLTTIVFTDIVGYSVLCQENEAEALALLVQHNAIMRKQIAAFDGQERKTIGDAFVIEFDSAVKAVEFGLSVLEDLRQFNAAREDMKPINIRIAIHIGDVFHSGDDFFGDAVNITARVQAQANPGQLVVTRQVLDQLVNQEQSYRSKRIQSIRGKNIRDRVQVYVIESQHGDGSSRLTRLFTNNLDLSGRLGKTGLAADISSRLFRAIAVLSTLAVIMCLSHLFNRAMTEFTSALTNKRQGEMFPIDHHNWQFYGGTKDLSLLSDRELGALKWQPMNEVKEKVSSSGQPEQFWMKKEFILPPGYESATPAIVLGLVGKAHLAYLNGSYIGGAKFLSELAYYTFDPKLLKVGEVNTLHLKVTAQKYHDASVRPLEGVGSWLGDVSVIQTLVQNNNIKFHVVRTSLLFLTIFAIGLYWCYFHFMRRTRELAYYACFLSMILLTLVYYNLFSSLAFSFEVMRLLKLAGTTLAPLMVLSATLYRAGKTRLEAFNSIVIFGLLSAEVTLFLAFGELTADRARTLEMLFLQWTVVVFTLIGFAVLIDLPRQFRKNGPLAGVKVTMTFLIALAAFGLTLSSLPDGGSRVTHDFLEVLGVSSPALLCLDAILILSLEGNIVALSRRKGRERGQYLADLAEITYDGVDSGERIRYLFERASQLIAAKKATLYLNSNAETSIEDVCLERLHYLGNPLYAKSATSIELTKDSLIGQAFNLRKTLWIHDIERDSRLRDASRHNGRVSRYFTKSCIIAPLFFGGEIIGVLCFADKSNGQAFDVFDLKFVETVRPIFSLLLQQPQKHLAKDCTNVQTLSPVPRAG